jgi:hypothetical protein
MPKPIIGRPVGLAHLVEVVISLRYLCLDGIHERKTTCGQWDEKAMDEAIK